MDRKEYHKKRYLEKREKLLQQTKNYQEKNKEKLKEYRQTEKYRKRNRISNWKHRGIIFHDYNLLYEMYLQTTHCDKCNCLLTYDKTTTKTTKCLDHDHSITDDENVRNILCNCCNVKRK